MEELSYIAVSYKSNILAQSTNNDGDYDIATNEILNKHEIFDQKIHFEKNGEHFYILHAPSGVNVIGASDSNALAESVYEILDNTYRAFMIAFPYDISSREKYSLQRNFESQLNTFVDQTKYKDFPENSDDIVHVFEQASPANEQLTMQNPQNKIFTTKKWKIFFSKYKFVLISIVLLTLILIALLSLLAYV